MRTLKSILISSFLAIGILFTSCKGEHKEHEHEHDKKHKKEWNQQDHKLVKAAILDYVEGLYQVDSTRIEKSVDPTLRKIGYWYNKKEKAWTGGSNMSYNQLVNLAARWNKSGNQVNENTPKKIKIYDVNTRTASAKLTAAWGVDYFHLSKINDQWKIMNVIWQSIPETKK
tara:strand:+ start:3036 stop:3548 length:513 start_codon:yes stop_codon:yes gene_type:complete